MSIGKTIADKRKALGLTLKDLAGLVTKEDGSTVSIQYVSDIEHNHRTPSPAVLESLAEALGMEVAFLQAVARQAPSSVTDYLAAHPDTAVAVEVLFTKALHSKFTNWSRLKIS